MIDNASFDKEKDAVEQSDPAPAAHRPPVFLSDSHIIATLLNNSQDTVYFKDWDSKFILNSKSHAVQFGYSDPEDLIGKSDFDFYPEVFANESRRDELEIMNTGVPVINKMEQGMNAAGDILTFSSSKYPLYDSRGAIVGTWGTSRDMSKLVHAEEELAKANAKLRALSLIDELTGLYNQRHFYDSLTISMKLYARRRIGGLTAHFSLILLDIDHFKQVNDTYGHVIGDAAIRYIGGLMTAHTRASDTSFRYGGDEYALILPDTEVSAARDLCERLRKIVEQNPLLADGQRIELTISMGVIGFNNELSAGDMVRKADTLLYRAKKDGRNRVCWQPENV